MELTHFKIEIHLREDKDWEAKLLSSVDGRKFEQLGVSEISWSPHMAVEKIINASEMYDLFTSFNPQMEG